MELSRFLGASAAEGNEAALIEMRDELASKSLVAEKNAEQMLSILSGRTQAQSDTRQRFLEISRNFIELGERDLAALFRKAAYDQPVGDRLREKLEINILSDRRRAFELKLLDSELRLPVLGHKVDSGFLPAKIRLDQSASYLLVVESADNEPRVQIPISTYINASTPEELNVDLSDWQGLDRNFTWVPPFSCKIGGDLVARDALPDMVISVGPIAISEKQVRLEEYLSYLLKRRELSDASNHFPTYMGMPLVTFERNQWKPLDLSVKSGHDWRDLPVVGIDYESAHEYCVDYHLPNNLIGDLLNEYEWEAIGRGPDGRLFPWGDFFVPGFSNIVETNGTSDNGLETVGFRTTDQSAFGLFDMSGNAEEWCKFGTPAIQGEHPGFAMARGGSWYNPVQPSRLASRVTRYSDYRHKKLSFRVAARLRS